MGTQFLREKMTKVAKKLKEIKDKYDDPEVDRQLRKGGIVKNRDFTDVICTGIFVIFVGIWLAIIAEAHGKGEFKKLVYPKDSSGRICGYDHDVLDKPFLMYYNPLSCLDSGLPGEV